MTTYYVSTTGNDNNSGTLSSPWKTIQKAANTLVAGDTVYIRGGTYSELINVPTSGSSGNYITFAAYPGENAIVDATGKPLTLSGMFTITGKSYIKISGLTLQNYVPSDPNQYFALGVSITGNSHHITVENNTINKTGGPGIWAYNNMSSNSYKQGDEDIVLDGNTLIDNNIMIIPGITMGSNEDLDIVATNNFVVKNNTIINGWKEGIDLKEGSGYGTVYGNKIYVGNNINGAGIYLDTYSSTPTHDIDIYQNYITARTFGVAISTESSGYIQNVRIFNNIFDRCSAYGVRITNWGSNTQKSNVSVINNNFYGSSSGSGMQIDYNTSVPGMIIRNNIFSKNGTQLSVGPTGVTIDHNLFDGSTSVTGSAYITGDPKFVNPTASVPDFHLQSTSPSIDTGSSTGAPAFDFDNVSRPQGAGFDIGAYEYAATQACTQPAVVFTLA